MPRPLDVISLLPLGPRPYDEVVVLQKEAEARAKDGGRETLFLLEHEDVITAGRNAGTDDLNLPAEQLARLGVAFHRSDRGGKLTFHGPGQLVAYLLLDLPRRRLKVRELVNLMEQAIIDTLADYGIEAERKDGAPGVYVAGDKIAALGLRVRNGCSYHGLAINVDADLAPFGWINPCGYEGLKTIRMKDFGVEASVEAVGECLLGHLQRLLPPRRPTPAPDIGETDNANPPAEPAAAVRAGS